MMKKAYKKHFFILLVWHFLRGKSNENKGEFSKIKWPVSLNKLGMGI